jgi:putative DNA primase/helicase
LSAGIDAADLATRLRLHRCRNQWRGQCPVCAYPEAFALSASKGGRLLGWCASCQDGTAIAHLLAEMQGGAAAPERVEQRDAAARQARTFERAMALWNGSEPVPGTLAGRYLTARGLPHLAASSALRFRPDCSHPSRARLPAMIALVQGADGDPVGIHRTYLRRDGSAKANIEPPRAALGQVRGGAIRLDPLAAEIVIGEGIETAASAGLLLGLPAWSAVSAGNMGHALMLPTQVRCVAIAADPGEPGRRAAAAAWHRWTAEGLRVRISTPKGEGDCNDILMRRLALGGGT